MDLKKEECGRSYHERTQVALAGEGHAHVENLKKINGKERSKRSRKINAETIGCAVSRVVYSI
jgi:hypothetical protein